MGNITWLLERVYTPLFLAFMLNAHLAFEKFEEGSSVGAWVYTSLAVLCVVADLYKTFTEGDK